MDGGWVNVKGPGNGADRFAVSDEFPSQFLLIWLYFLWSAEGDAARQCQTQQVGAPTDRAPALDRLGLLGKVVEIKRSWKSPQQCVKLIYREKGCVWHLPPESYRDASGQALI